MESALSVRDSGYAVDVRGAALGLLEEMGILGEVREHETKMRGTTLVDETGAETGRLPAEAFAGDADRLTVSLSFATDTAALDQRDRDGQEQAIRAAFAGNGWEAPRLLDEMAQAADFYFASACQVELDRWSHGRIALIGDAGYCAAPTSGMGTSQALIGARVLARELAESGGDHRAGFVAYERELRPDVLKTQAIGREGAKMFGAAA
ncbi:FAD-dependent monooxygenase [Cryptosporangium minutisporangium]|uniref:FAD-dependent monooxygenase n=1 Tax=Cryptosporangium minutisporangium TaxID=113569 RepID=UPI0031E7812A